jgi:UDP-2,3-diacylglucosamine pyrophosphatase LpxH
MNAVHRTADGRSLLITHGDEFDLVVQNSRFLALAGGWAYDHLVNFNRAVNWLRARVGLSPWSFSRAIKAKVKGACTFMSNYEDALLGEAKRRGLHGVVCGHIHQPALREATADKPLYANCGDWIEHPTALVEHADGRLELLDVRALLAAHNIQPDAAGEPAVELEPLDLDPATLQPTAEVAA